MRLTASTLTPKSLAKRVMGYSSGLCAARARDARACAHSGDQRRARTVDVCERGRPRAHMLCEEAHFVHERPGQAALGPPRQLGRVGRVRYAGLGSCRQHPETQDTRPVRPTRACSSRRAPDGERAGAAVRLAEGRDEVFCVNVAQPLVVFGRHERLPSAGRHLGQPCHVLATGAAPAAGPVAACVCVSSCPATEKRAAACARKARTPPPAACASPCTRSQYSAFSSHRAPCVGYGEVARVGTFPS